MAADRRTQFRVAWRSFVDQFFTKFNEFQKAPRHPKWREVNLAAQVPGWKRFDAAEEWLARNRAQQQAVGSQQDFDRFLAGRPIAQMTAVPGIRQVEPGQPSLRSRS